MLSKHDKHSAKWDFIVRLSQDDHAKGFITKERFIELLKDDLRSGGYEITKVDWDFIRGNYMSIKNPDGNYELVYGTKLPDQIPV